MMAERRTLFKVMTPGNCPGCDIESLLNLVGTNRRQGLEQLPK